jgi:acyl-CoA thioesterase-1
VKPDVTAQTIKVVCLGDSITWGFPHGAEYSWVSMLAETVDGEFINQGINGNTTTDMLRRFDRSVLRYNPTHVIIMGGINDVIWNDSFDRITTNLETMIRIAKKNGIKVILGTPTAVDQPSIERLLVRIRTWINDYARQNAIPIIDFAAAFRDSGGGVRKDLLLADGAHPTRAGYQALFDVIDKRVFAE